MCAYVCVYLLQNHCGFLYHLLCCLMSSIYLCSIYLCSSKLWSLLLLSAMLCNHPLGTCRPISRSGDQARHGTYPGVHQSNACHINTQSHHTHMPHYIWIVGEISQVSCPRHSVSARLSAARTTWQREDELCHRSCRCVERSIMLTGICILPSSVS